jgi:hypothetical protein
LDHHRFLAGKRKPSGFKADFRQASKPKTPKSSSLANSPFAEPGLPIAMKATTGAKKQKWAVQLLFPQLQPCFRSPSAEPGLPIAMKAIAGA